MGEPAHGLWESLAGRYTRGSGGMAVVCLAHDLKPDPYFLSPRWLRVDPTLDELLRQPRFQKLVEGTA